MKVSRILALMTLPCLVAAADEPAPVKALSPANAITLVKHAVVFAKQNGMDTLIKETNKEGGKFHVASGGELYIFIYDTEGVVKAIGFNTEALVGKNRMELKDPDGKPFIREIIETAKTKGKGWVTYKYPNPTNGKIDEKISYLEMCDGMIIGSGTYRE